MSSGEKTTAAAAAVVEDSKEPHFQLIGPISTRTFRCLWMLEELGLSYQHLSSKPRSAAAKAHHPLGKVPVLIQRNDKEEPPFYLYESAAICTYLGDYWYNNHHHDSLDDETSQESLFVPQAGTRLRGLYDQTMSFITCEVDSQGLWVYDKHCTMGDIFGHFPDAVAAAQEHWRKSNVALVQQIRRYGGAYLLGPHFTAADILYMHCLVWSRGIGWWNHHPNGKNKEKDADGVATTSMKDDDDDDDAALLSAYYDRCAARPAFGKLMAWRQQEGTAFASAQSRMG